MSPSTLLPKGEFQANPPYINSAFSSHLAQCLLKVAITHTFKGLGLQEDSSSFAALIRDESVPSDQRGYILLDCEQTIEENLRGIVVIDVRIIDLMDANV